MSAQPTDLSWALERALCRVLGGYRFEGALNDFVSSLEQLKGSSYDSLSEWLGYGPGLEIELRDEYSGRTETFRMKIERQPVTDICSASPPRRSRIHMGGARRRGRPE
ncbi:hypothetical protein SAMN04489712_12910 [Thermomonospora echinospora]|uniref:Uncharacterized protein n=1 Tax=Thermomonospora echinospora TaxID=1992 RepID=A0A1H6E3F4_9ACTN|nr:hypothetical protein [Thermomonospora echinospora]SEG91415.1 hypothetical protein SAMN04489712_12910 [Thermomonospora echinospora]